MIRPDEAIERLRAANAVPSLDELDPAELAAVTALLEDQLRNHREHFEAGLPAMIVDDATTPRSGSASRFKGLTGRRHPARVAVTAAAAVLLLGGGGVVAAWLFGGDPSPVCGELSASAVPGSLAPFESQWREVQAEITPASRGHHRMVYDAESDVVIMVGGLSVPLALAETLEQDQYEDTWAYDTDTATWIQMAAGQHPDLYGDAPRRTFGDLAYDAGSDLIVAFRAETWTYDYNHDTWTKMAPATQPNPETANQDMSYAMAYDNESDRVILFGAIDQDTVDGIETWAYDVDTDTWTKMNPAASPAPRRIHDMAYDEQSDRIVLFGGDSNASHEHSDTWAYDFNTDTWEPMHPAVSPPPLAYPKMEYDPNADRVVLFGGGSHTKGCPGPDEFWTESDQVWVYDYETDTWGRLLPDGGPAPRKAHDIAFDTGSGKLIVFGGDELGPPPPACNCTRTVGYQNETWTLTLLP
jgi:hypothetical protein